MEECIVADITLVIMAAGMGSRYGGIKQLEPVGPGGEIIMDYSIYDAIRAGFNKIVFIIRRDIEEDFNNIIGKRLPGNIKTEYVFQELDKIPSFYVKPEDRTKPWGTGHAILCCKDVVNEPFAVINADDYYGREGFGLIYEFLNSSARDDNNYCMAGFILGNTLSKNGGVTRGICRAGSDGMLEEIVETSGIIQSGDMAKATGSGKEDIYISLNSVVSMNMWGFKPGLFNELEIGFNNFLKGLPEKELKKEYLLPEAVGELVKKGKASVKVLKTSDRWFGVTYKEDKASVVDSIRELVDKGVYPPRLF
jgi:hypothetical protein